LHFAPLLLPFREGRGFYGISILARFFFSVNTFQRRFYFSAPFFGCQHPQGAVFIIARFLERQQQNFSANREVSKSAVGKATNGERFFLEGSAPALPKNSFLGTSGDVPSSFVNLWMV